MIAPMFGTVSERLAALRARAQQSLADQQPSLSEAELRYHPAARADLEDIFRGVLRVSASPKF